VIGRPIFQTILAAVLIAIPAAAAASQETGRISGAASTAEMFDLAARLISQGRYEEAKRILRLLESNPNRDVQNEARFRRATLLSMEKRPGEAAVLLRRIVDDRPDAAPARLHLASALQALGDERAASRELRALRSGDLPPTVAKFVDRLSASLQSNKTFGLQVELSAAPDTNINRATRSDTLGTVLGEFDLNDEAQAKSGFGFAFRGMSHARASLSERLMIEARSSLEANLYRQREFNDVALDLSLGPKLRLGPSSTRLEIGATQQWYGMRAYQRALRLGLGASVAVDPVSKAQFDLTARKVDHRWNDLQDGTGLGLRVRYERALSPSLLIATSLAADRFVAREDAYSTRSWQVGLSAYRDVGRMTISLGVDVGRLKADERLALLPFAREDRLTRLQLGFVNRALSIAGFAPMTRLVIERNKSSVEFYDYQRRRMEFGVTRAF
jgi:hypothetical protein